MLTLACARQLQKSCRFSSTRQFHVCSGDHPSLSLTVLVCRDLPAWKRLISDTLSTDERIPLIKSIFSDRDEVVVFEYLSGDDAQAFVNVIDEASIRILLSLKIGQPSLAKTSAPRSLGFGKHR